MGKCTGEQEGQAAFSLSPFLPCPPAIRAGSASLKRGAGNAERGIQKLNLRPISSSALPVPSSAFNCRVGPIGRGVRLRTGRLKVRILHTAPAFALAVLPASARQAVALGAPKRGAQAAPVAQCSPSFRLVSSTDCRCNAMSMSQEQIIDFTSNDIGLWLFFVLSSVLALVRLKRTDLSGGWRQSIRVILCRIVIGAAIVSPLVLFLAVWQRTSPHYFIRMIIADERITLGFRWPKPDVVIPIDGVRSISYWKRESLRRSFKRIQVDTSVETYRSYGYNQMAVEDYRAIERLRARVQSAATVFPTNVQPPKLP